MLITMIHWTHKHEQINLSKTTMRRIMRQYDATQVVHDAWSLVLQLHDRYAATLSLDTIKKPEMGN